MEEEKIQEKSYIFLCETLESLTLKTFFFLSFHKYKTTPTNVVVHLITCVTVTFTFVTIIAVFSKTPKLQNILSFTLKIKEVCVNLLKGNFSTTLNLIENTANYLMDKVIPVFFKRVNLFNRISVPEYIWISSITAILGSPNAPTIFYIFKSIYISSWDTLSFPHNTY